MMIKTLTAVGNSLGLIIDKPVLELLGIDKDTRLEIRTDGEGLIIRPVREPASPSASVASSTPAPAPPAPAPAAARPRTQSSKPPAPPPPAMAPPPPGLDGPLPPTSADADADVLDDELDDLDEPAAPAPAPPPPPPAPRPAPADAELDPATSAGTPKAKVRGDSSGGPSSTSGRVPDVVVELKGEEVVRVALTGQELIIGRDHTADVHLDDRALSRKHAKIEKRGAAIWVQDLGSANGTYVNGEKVIEPRPLLAGDVIGVGHYKVRVDGALEAGDKTPVLTLTGPEGTHRFALVGDQIVIGRSQGCDISIGHKSISRRHVRIGKDDDGFLIEDLGSQNGCKLNGKQLKGSAPFGLGDRIDICDFSLTLGFLEDDAKPGTDDDDKPRRPATMLIDKSAMAQAAYVDGDFENVRSKLASNGAPPGPAKADTGEYEVGGGAKKPKVVRPKRR